jgi:hypothetical protein
VKLLRLRGQCLHLVLSELRLKRQNFRKKEKYAELLMYLVVGSRGHRVRRQEMRCEGYCGAMLSAPLTALMPAL